jgi:flagellar M-ring protein FliF
MRLSSAIEQLLAKSLGSNNAKVQVSAELDMQRITTNREKFDPESKVERSTQNNNESSQENNKEGSSAVSAGSNLPATTTGGAAAPQNSQNSQSNRTSETVNYEISKVITNEVQEPGQIKRLSVAVLVNNKETKKEDGTVSSEPRSAEELTQLQELVKTAAGFDEKRGDTVKVVNLPFSATIEPLPEESSSLMGFTKEDIKDVLEMVILSVVAMLVLLIVVRPFLNKIMQPIGAAIGDGSAASAMLGAPANQARVLQQQGVPIPAITAPGAFNEQQTEMPDTSEMDEMVNLARVSGQVKAATVRQIGDLIEKNTDDSVAVIRNWLYQEPAKGNS